MLIRQDLFFYYKFKKCRSGGPKHRSEEHLVLVEPLNGSTPSYTRCTRRDRSMNHVHSIGQLKGLFFLREMRAFQPASFLWRILFGSQLRVSLALEWIEAGFHDKVFFFILSLDPWLGGGEGNTVRPDM